MEVNSVLSLDDNNKMCIWSRKITHRRFLPAQKH